MKQRNFHMAVLVLFVCLLFCIVEQAQAKDDSTAADQDLAQKEGGLGSKEIDASKLPGKLEYAIVIGSIIAAICVVKFV